MSFSYRQTYIQIQTMIRRLAVKRTRSVGDLKMSLRHFHQRASLTISEANISSSRGFNIHSQSVIPPHWDNKKVPVPLPFPQLVEAIQMLPYPGLESPLSGDSTNLIPDSSYVDSFFFFNLSPKFVNNEYMLVSMYCLQILSPSHQVPSTLIQAHSPLCLSMFAHTFLSSWDFISSLSNSTCHDLPEISPGLHPQGRSTCLHNILFCIIVP